MVARLYKDYAWQVISTQTELFGPSLGQANKVTLQKYFTPTMANLLAEDIACATRTRELCNLDVTKTSPGKVHVQFKDPVTSDTTRIEFKLVNSKADGVSKTSFIALIRIYR